MRGIVWLSNGKGGGLPGNTEAPLPTRLIMKSFIIVTLMDSLVEEDSEGWGGTRHSLVYKFKMIHL